MLKTALTIALAALLVTACRPGTREDYSRPGINDPARPFGSPKDPNAPPANAPLGNPVIPPNKNIPAKQPSAVAPQSVQVQLTEYAIQIPDTLPAGSVELNIANAGKEDHSFAIDGGDLHTQLHEPLKRGDTAQLIVTLKPGTYTVYCPVDGHRGKGMQKSVTVR